MHTSHELRVEEEWEANTFQRLVEVAPDAIIVVDVDGRITLANTQAALLFGYEREDLLGQAIELLIPERYREQHVAHRAAYVAEPRTRPMGAHGLDLRGRRKDGSEFPAEISLSPLATSHGLLVTAIVRDVSKRMREAEEEQVRHKLNEYASILRNTFTHTDVPANGGDRPTETRQP